MFSQDGYADISMQSMEKIEGDHGLVTARALVVAMNRKIQLVAVNPFLK